MAMAMTGMSVAWWFKVMVVAHLSGWIEPGSVLVLVLV